MVKINLIEQNKVLSTVDTSGIQRAAQAGQSISNVLLQEEARQQKIEKASIDAEISRANSELNLSLNNSLNSVKNDFRDKPEDGEKFYQDNIDSQISRISDSLSTDKAKEAFNAQTFKYSDTYKAKANNWASTQKVQNIATNIDFTNKNYADQAYELGKQGDFNGLDTMMLSQQDAIAKALPALSAKEGRRMSESAIKESFQTFFGGLTRTEPVLTQQAIRSGKYDHILSEKERDAILDNSALQLSSNINKDNNLKSKNPFAWVEVREGQAPQIDFSNGKELQNSLLDRKMYVDMGNQKYPDANMNYLNDQEIKFIQEGIANSTPDEAVAFMNTLNINMPDNMINKVSRELFEKDASLGAAFAISDENPQLAAQTIQGIDLVKNKSVPDLPSERDLNTVYQEVYGNSIKDTILLDQVLGSARAAYASHIFNGGKIDNDAYKDILKQLIGDSANINGQVVNTFRDMNRNIVTASDLEDYFDTDIIQAENNLSDTDFIESRLPFPLAGTTPINAEQIVKYGVLESVGDGLYNVRLRTNNRYLLSADGNPYQLDMRAIHNNRVMKKQARMLETQQKVREGLKKVDDVLDAGAEFAKQILL